LDGEGSGLLFDSGVREVATRAGRVFLHDDEHPYAPGVDLIEIAYIVAEVLEADGYHVESITVADELMLYVFDDEGDHVDLAAASRIPQHTVYIRPTLHPSIIDRTRSNRLSRRAQLVRGLPGPAGFNLFGFHGKTVDSFWLHLIVEVGVVGFACYLLWLAALARQVRGSPWALACIVFGMVIAVFSPAWRAHSFRRCYFSWRVLPG
jgi:hypothetical protein